MSFAHHLKSTRESLGLSQAEAAALLECGKRTLEHWEAGDRVPLAVTQEGAIARLRTTKRPRTRKGQNASVSYGAERR
jgi:DNA-binding transcriptional regulator YiaG